MFCNTIVLYFASYIVLIASSECGIRKIVNKESETSVGTDEFPWHLGLYTEGRLVCGATLLSPTVSITGAHCFPNSTTYTLVAGKYYRNLNHPNDGENTQQTKVVKIIVHPEYNDGEPINMFDLALMVHDQPFHLGSNVMPACFDATIKSNEDLIDKRGIIVGWGHKTPNNDSIASDVLQMVEVDYKPIRADCILPLGFKKYYSSDKLCAGLYKKGKGVCRGDGGGGLMHMGSNGRYYIRGILSSAPTVASGCDYNSNALYTSTAYFANFIANVTSIY